MSGPVWVFGIKLRSSGRAVHTFDDQGISPVPENMLILFLCVRVFCLHVCIYVCMCTMYVLPQSSEEGVYTPELPFWMVVSRVLGTGPRPSARTASALDP